MAVTVYNFESLLEYIEKNKETIDIVICGVGDDFNLSYEVVYRKEKGYLKDLSVQNPKICGLRFVHADRLWGVIIHIDNTIEQIGVGKREELSKEQTIAFTDEFLSNYKDLIS